MTRGFMTAFDVPKTTIDGEDLNQIWDEFQATLTVANEQRTALAALLTYGTTNESDLVAQLGALDDFEEASEFGVPTAMAHKHETLRMGFPLKWYDKATRFTWKFLLDATGDQVRTIHSQALEADNRLMYTNVLGALMSNVNRTNEDGHTVFALWNADGQVPPDYAGEEFDGTHTHYLTTGSTDVDGTDLRDLITHITQHGYATEPGERVLILVNPQEGETVRGFRVSEGDPYDFIPSESAPAFLTTEQVIGERPPSTYNGLSVIGGYGPAWVVENHFVPKGYVVAVATAGANSDRNPLAFREHTRPEYQGLRQIPGADPAYPLSQSYYSRGFGVGTRHRGAAAVMQVTASSTYTPPTL